MQPTIRNFDWPRPIEFEYLGHPTLGSALTRPACPTHAQVAQASAIGQKQTLARPSPSRSLLSKQKGPLARPLVWVVLERAISPSSTPFQAAFDWCPP